MSIPVDSARSSLFLSLSHDSWSDALARILTLPLEVALSSLLAEQPMHVTTSCSVPGGKLRHCPAATMRAL